VNTAPVAVASHATRARAPGAGTAAGIRPSEMERRSPTAPGPGGGGGTDDVGTARVYVAGT